MTIELDATPLPTDWTDLDALFADMRRHARENPDDEFLCADHPGHTPRFGWVAFKKNVADGDDFSKAWTITLSDARSSRPETLRRLRNRQAHLQSIISTNLLES